MAILDWFIRSKTERAIANAVEEHLQSDAFRKMVLREIRASMPHFDFVKQIQARLQEVEPTMPDKQAYEHALNLFNDWCFTEKCQFGDDRFDWTEDGARALADEDISHWEHM